MKTNEQLSRSVASRSHDHTIRTIKNPKLALKNCYNTMQLISEIDCVQF